MSNKTLSDAIFEARFLGQDPSNLPNLNNANTFGAGTQTIPTVSSTTVTSTNIVATNLTATTFTALPATLSVNGAIPFSTGCTFAITKGSILADTLAAPTVGSQDGLEITVTSNTAFAHTITATGLLQTGTASVNVATFAAFAGASLTLMAYQGKWNVISSVGITFS